MRLARVLHCAIGMIASGNAFDAGVLNSIKAASDTILGGNRDATDTELLGLENLIDQLIPSEGGVSASATSATGEADIAAPPSEEPSPAAEVSAPLNQTASSAAGDEQGSEVHASEAGDDSSSQGLESVTAVAPPEASLEAPAEPVTEQLTEEPQPAPISPSDELFQEQSHDEDDAA